MSIIQGTGRGGARRFYNYPIEQSLLFDGSSYLSRTPTTAGSSTVWTLSMWLKRASTLNGSGKHYILSRGDTHFSFINSDYFAVNLRTSTTNYFYITNAVYKDLSSWYHFVVSCNLGNSGTDKLKVYLNGELISVSDLSDTTYQNATTTGLNTAAEHAIGRYNGNEPYYVGYLANMELIDGQALDASYFGETKQDIWIPKTFDGTSSTGGSTVSTDYGTNGFLLDFSSISGTTINDTAPIDTNHSSANNWTATGF